MCGLPFLTALATSERYADHRQKRHKKLTDWGRQCLLQAARWLPDRKIIAAADSSFAAIELLRAVRRRMCMITRLRLDARLFNPPARRRPGTIGRPRVIGKRQATLAKRLADPKPRWRRLQVSGWYGRSERLVEIVSGTALWHHPAIARTTPALLGLFSLVTLWAHDLYAREAPAPRAASWYSKHLSTFSDTLARVRRELWTYHDFHTSAITPDLVKLPRAAIDALIGAACYAA